MMMLLTKDNIISLPAIGSQENNPDPIIKVKYFYGGSTWGAYEASPCPDITGDINDYEFFGWVTHSDGFAELGYFYLSELKSFKDRIGLGIERDRYFKPIPLSQFKKDYP